MSHNKSFASVELTYKLKIYGSNKIIYQINILYSKTGPNAKA